ncbi:hypothetical protein KKE06_00555 [Candidatus Micrarchaeota archaeon]|nr:hypothetical protein [Candidatus Micrarchaeota archaeon]MBU1930579.1 hypothetical protein [Candidatus Micrarchaeota archaeon]
MAVRKSGTTRGIGTKFWQAYRVGRGPSRAEIRAFAVRIAKIENKVAIKEQMAQLTVRTLELEQKRNRASHEEDTTLTAEIAYNKEMNRALLYGLESPTIRMSEKMWNGIKAASNNFAFKVAFKKADLNRREQQTVRTQWATLQRHSNRFSGEAGGRRQFDLLESNLIRVIGFERAETFLGTFLSLRNKLVKKTFREINRWRPHRER